MPACPHCGHEITSDELGDLLTGVGRTPDPTCTAGGTTAKDQPVQSYLTAEPPLGPADARGPADADTSDVAFGL